MRVRTLFGIAIVCSLFSACGSGLGQTSYVAVMVDNHQLARPYQRGLDDAVWVQEHFVEGMITRFEAVYDVANFPASVGPVRSVRSYFIDGAVPAHSAIFHIGGSPDALERLAEPDAVPSFNATKFDRFFAYDDVAPAPHHRFLGRDGFRELFDRIEIPTTHTFPFPLGSFSSDGLAAAIDIDFHSEVHDVTYVYEPSSRTYIRRNHGARQTSKTANVVILETNVAVTGDLGRLSVRTEGSGNALLFRDGGVARGEWSKTVDSFYMFTDEEGNFLKFREGQVWMIVVDDLERVMWE